MKVTFLCVGTLKETYWKAALAEYVKRLSAYCSLQILEVAEARPGSGKGGGQASRIAREESDRLAEKIPDKQDVCLIALDIQGKMYASEDLSRAISQWTLAGKSHLVFLIGGSHGLSPQLLSRAQVRLSFSPMTFPHQLMRILLAEQLYRAFTIRAGGKYHK